VPVLARRRYPCCDALDELQGRENELRAPVGTGLGQVIDQAVGIALLEPLGGEGRPGAVAQQTFEPAPVIRFDAHGCIQGEPAAVLPSFPVPAIVLV
jgi:hypothetical protein